MGKYLLWTFYLADEVGALREAFGQKKVNSKVCNGAKKTTKYIVKNT